jgi:predicted nucleotidyltransferase
MHVLLIGSAALGDYVPGVSDLDVAVVAPDAVADPEATAAPLRHAELPCPASKLELVVYRADQAAAPSRDLEFELDLNTGADDDRLLTELDGEPEHWYLIDLAIAREHGIALAAPPARELIGEPPRADVLDALLDGLRWSLEEERIDPNTTLNACRAWCFAEEGTWLSKGAAADWAERRGVHSQAVRRALETRLGTVTAGPDPEHPDRTVEVRVTLPVGLDARPVVEDALAAVEGAR